MKLLFIVNSARYFVQHRLSLAKRASVEGYRVSVAAEPDDPHSVQLIRDAKIGFFPLPPSPTGLDPLGEFRSFQALRRILRELRPRLTHTMTIKSVVYGGILSRLLKIPMLALIPGRGTAFATGGLRGRVLRWTACLLYRPALRHAGAHACFENVEDKTFFEEHGLVDPRRSYRVMGSGVNVEKFAYTPYDQAKGSRRIVMLAARMLREKGIVEFIESASIVRRRYPEVVFRLVGEPDARNPGSLSRGTIEELCAAHCVEYLGFQWEMPRILSECDIFCLPSYYAEGIPVSLLEAAAMGKAIVTTDTPGCRDVVLNAQTGLLIPPRLASALAEAILSLIEAPETCAAFTAGGRRRIEEVFRDDAIHKHYLLLYESLAPWPATERGSMPPLRIEPDPGRGDAR